MADNVKWSDSSSTQPLYVICSDHPLAFRTILNALSCDPDLADRVRPYSDEYKSLSAPLSEVLLLDTCSVSRWRDILEKWCLRGACSIALVSEEAHDVEKELEMMFLGALGIVNFCEDLAKQLPAAVHAALQGTLWVPRRSLSEFVKRTNSLLRQLSFSEQLLTKREQQIIEFLRLGWPNKQIADALGISERTAKFHVSNLLRKYQMESRYGFLQLNSQTFPVLDHKGAFSNGYPPRNVSEAVVGLPASQVTSIRSNQQVLRSSEFRMKKSC